MITGRRDTEIQVDEADTLKFVPQKICGQYVATNSKNNPINKRRKERRNAASQSGTTRKQLSFNFNQQLREGDNQKTCRYQFKRICSASKLISVQGVSERIGRVFKQQRDGVSYKPQVTINSLFPHPKEQDDSDRSIQN